MARPSERGGGDGIDRINYLVPAEFALLFEGVGVHSLACEFGGRRNVVRAKMRRAKSGR